VNASSFGIPGIALFSETAVRRTGVIFVFVLRLLVAGIAPFPMVGFASDVRLDIMFPLLLLALVLREWVV
jgi:hypothetical protein